jgi:putative transposase
LLICPLFLLIGAPPSTTTCPGATISSPSYAFVGEPETNGVAERFFRTLKEQIIHGRIYQTIDEVRTAVRDFIARYNAAWLLEKNGFQSPSDARAAWNNAGMKQAA